MTEQADKYRQAATQMERLAELDDEEESMKDSIQRELGIELKHIFTGSAVLSEHEEITKISDIYGLNASQARKELNAFPEKYVMQDKSIPDLVKKMRNSRRKLKGSQRDKMTKAIDTMIDAYTDH